MSKKLVTTKDNKKKSTMKKTMTPTKKIVINNLKSPAKMAKSAKTPLKTTEAMKPAAVTKTKPVPPSTTTILTTTTVPVTNSVFHHLRNVKTEKARAATNKGTASPNQMMLYLFRACSR
jgi:hypothetical protein